MSITVLCPNLRCKTILHVPDKMRGQMIRCGQCGIHLSVPVSQGTKAPPKSDADGDQGQKHAASKKK